jgi:hypothetical protein
MTTAPPKETLPEGMAVVETAEGRWFPALAPSPSREIPRWVSLIDEPHMVPPALDPLFDSAEGYEDRDEAVAACWAWHEATVLLENWHLLAMYSEVYPERNSWYLEEIARLIGSDTHMHIFAPYGFATVMTMPHGGDEVLMARGMTRDETIANLYQLVYEWSYRQQARQQRAS